MTSDAGFWIAKRFIPARSSARDGCSMAFKLKTASRRNCFDRLIRTPSSIGVFDPVSSTLSGRTAFCTARNRAASPAVPDFDFDLSDA